MYATFRTPGPDLLLEAQPGDLFFPLGPDYVECVCALQSHDQLSRGNACLSPTTMVGIVVIACRAQPGEIGYYPPGSLLQLSGAAPVTFVEPVGGIQLQARQRAQDNTFQPDELVVLATARVALERRPSATGR